MEGAGGGKLAELVSDHVLGDVDGDELAAVVDGEGQTDCFREDGGTTRPGLDGSLGFGRVRLVDLGHQVAVDKGTFLN